VKQINAIDRKYKPSIMSSIKVVQELLWSDPAAEHGFSPSYRGLGQNFGPDVVTEFLQREKLGTVIRSHEVVQTGVELSVAGGSTGCGALPMGLSLYTVFSSSNYNGGSNDAGVLRYSDLTAPELIKFRTTATPSTADVAHSNTIKLSEFLTRRHHRMLRAFQHFDPENRGQVHCQDWVNAMQKSVELQVDWRQMQPQLAPADDKGNVLYHEFLQRFDVEHVSQQVPEGLKPAFHALYDQYPLLRAVFHKWDTNHDGMVDRTEFTRGVAMLNQFMSGQNEQHTPLDAVQLFALIDIDGDGAVQLNEFCECFRLSTQSVV